MSLLSVIATKPDGENPIVAKVSHHPPTLLCAINSSILPSAAPSPAESDTHDRSSSDDTSPKSPTFGREASQRGVVIEYPAIVSFEGELAKNLLVQEDCVLELRFDFSRFMSFLRRSVTVLADGIPVGSGASAARKAGPKNSIAVPGYVEAAQRNDGAAAEGDDDDDDDGSRRSQQKTITWIGRLDMGKHGSKLFTQHDGKTRLSKSSLKIRLVLGGNLMHASRKKDKPVFTLMAPLFQTPEPTKLVSRIAAVALSPAASQKYRVEVSSAFAVEKFEGSEGHSYRNAASFQIAFLPRKEIASSSSSSSAKGGGGVSSSSIEIRATDPDELHLVQQHRSVDLVLELKILPAESVDDRLAKVLQLYLPGWLVSPWTLVGAFLIVFVALIVMAVILSARADRKRGNDDYSEDF